LFSALGTVLLAVAIAGTISSTIFFCLALTGAVNFRHQAARQRYQCAQVREWPPVSVLKPLHGIEQQLEANLESFFLQDYPEYEVLFAVDEANDGALPVARAVCARHPEITSKIVINGVAEWPNPPAWSLAAMAREAQHNILVTSDSDVMVGRNYLHEVVSPLLEREAGMVTCIYRGRNAGGFWSALDGMGMSVEMTAGVLVAKLMEGMNFGLGPTIAVRRDALNAIGGYQAIGEYFSNDFIIGNLIAERGYKVVLSRHIVDHVVPAMTFRRMWRRQLRWAMGTKYSRPKGHFGTGLIFAVPFGILGLAGGLLTAHGYFGFSILLWALLNRIIECLVIGYGVMRDRKCLNEAWLYPVRDLFGFSLWVASYLGNNSVWRRGNFALARGGKIISLNGVRRGSAAAG
jgi:ceramide glucosyltransferase